MAIKSRNVLKKLFQKGQVPSEKNFFDLIDSSVNLVDDGFSKSLGEGLRLFPLDNSRKLLSFFKSIEEKNPAWGIEVSSGEDRLYFNNRIGKSVLTLSSSREDSYKTGKVGINLDADKPEPEYELDVKGMVGMEGRLGTYRKGEVDADGKWHTVIDELGGCHAFEVVAGVGKPNSGRYALIHALALSTFGRSKNKIKITQAHYGVRCNKLDLRWVGTTKNFALQIRSRCNYNTEGQKESIKIKYYISNLWDEQFY